MKIWIDLSTEKEYFTKKELYNKILNTTPDMEIMCAALEKIYGEEIIKELERLKSPLYSKILKKAKVLWLTKEIIEVEETEYIKEDE